MFVVCKLENLVCLARLIYKYNHILLLNIVSRKKTYKKLEGSLYLDPKGF